LKETEEALRQVAISDVILINKIDTVDSDKRIEIRQLLEGINPQAYVMEGNYGAFDINEILKVGSTRTESIEFKLNTSPNHLHHDHDHSHNHVHNNHGITTFTLTFEGVFDLDALSLELYRIANLYRNQVYRVKGIIAIPNYENRVILQSVQSSFVATDGRPWEEGEDQTGKLVFIGRDLTKKVFQKMFDRYLINEFSKA
jgi:G3E family GTPase